MLMMASRHSSQVHDAAQAVNRIIRLDTESDHVALLEVLEDYFCSPGIERGEDSNMEQLDVGESFKELGDSLQMEQTDA